MRGLPLSVYHAAAPVPVPCPLASPHHTTTTTSQAGVLLSETKYRYQVEADIAPFRGLLLGLFFMTVGFEIDINLIRSQFPTIMGLLGGLLALKTAILTSLCLAFGLSLSNAQHVGLLLSQGGEFAFVAFGMAKALGILAPGPGMYGWMWCGVVGDGRKGETNERTNTNECSRWIDDSSQHPRHTHTNKPKNETQPSSC